VLGVIAMPTTWAAPGDEPKSGVGISVTAKRGQYPIAIVASGEAEVAQVATNDFNLEGQFKVLDPASFLDTNQGLDIDPAKWKSVGAFGVVKYRVSATDIEFRFYEIGKADKATVTKTYSRKDSPRLITHKFCNLVVKHLTGDTGFFGSRIAFTQKAKGGSQIVAMDFDGFGQSNVSNNSSVNILPAWSPNGQIAYTSFMRNNPDLYVTNGGRARKLSGQPGMNTGAAWSPDGSKIALTLSKDGNPEIYVISSTDGSIIKRITNDKSIDTSPAWSPDGGKLAFVSDRNGGPQIFVVSANGGAATQVSFNGNYNTTPAWSPRKGKEIIAYTTRDKTYDIVTLDLQTKEMVRITENMGNNEEPSFAPNGHAIAYAHNGSNAGIYIANADGKGTPQKVWSGSATGVDWGPAPGP
jgi:TolB protein